MRTQEEIDEAVARLQEESNSNHETAEEAQHVLDGILWATGEDNTFINWMLSRSHDPS